MNERGHPTDWFAGSFFVGRERELTELLSGLEDAFSAHGRLFLVVGEAGIGKTRLVEELGGEASRRNSEVLWGRCREGEGAPPYWPWVQVMRSHMRNSDPKIVASEMGLGAPYIAQLVPEVRERFPNLPSPPTSPESEHARFYLFDAVTTFLKNTSVTKPPLLVFDDLQWADTPSLLLLQFFAHELRDTRILLVGTYRDVEVRRSPAVAEILGALVRDGHHMPLHGLSEEEVKLLIERTTGCSASEALVRTVYRKTEGNPFFVDEVVRVLMAEGALEHPDQLVRGGFRVPQGVRQAIRRRLAPLPEACKEILTVASVIGREFDLACLHRVCNLKLEKLLEVLDDALVSGIIVRDLGTPSRYCFFHALIRETLYEELALAERTRLHRRIGEVLEEIYQQKNPEPHLAELARHFLEAAPGGDAEKGVEYAVRAGKRAAASLAYEEAVEFYKRALQVLDLTSPADETQRCNLFLSLGEAQWRAGDGPGAKETFQQAADIARRVGDPALFARSALGFAGESSPTFWVEVGGVDQPVVKLLEEALEAVGERDGTLRSRLLARLAVDLYFSPSRERGLVLSEQAVALARQGGDPRVLAAALRARCVALWRPESLDERLTVATEMVSLAEETGDWELALPGHKFRILGFLERGDVTAADYETEAWARIAEELRQPLYLANLAMWRAMRAIMEGRFAEGEDLAELALDLIRQAGEVEATQHFVLRLGILRVHQGRIEELTQVVKTFADRNPTIPALRCYLAYLYCEQGRESEARREFASLARDRFSALPRDGLWLFGMSLLSSLCAGLGDASAAKVLYSLLLPYARRINMVSGTNFWGSVSHYLGQLAATLDRFKTATRHFEDALQIHDRMGAHPLVASTQYEYARAILAGGAAGERGKARDLLKRALATARELGMNSLAAKIRSLDPETEALRSRQEQAYEGPTADSSPASLSASTPSLEERIFRRDGDFWTIAYGGKVVRLKDTKGLRDIAILLANPGKQIHVADLIAASTDPQPDPRAAYYRQMTTEQLAEQGLQVSSGAAVELALDSRARSAYRARLADLHQELEDAERCNDPGRVARARAELDFIAGEIANAYGLGGRARQFGTPAERARKAVTWRIHASVAKIGREHPAVGRHLGQFIKTGTFCSYAVPEESATWSV